jgi:hypothetical protein
MRTWTDEELTRIGDAEELQISSLRRDGTLRPYVTIWVVRAGGLERDVTFEQLGGDVNAAIDAAYHAKYDRHGPAIVGTVVGKDAGATTIHLRPRSA